MLCPHEVEVARLRDELAAERATITAILDELYAMRTELARIRGAARR